MWYKACKAYVDNAVQDCNTGKYCLLAILSFSRVKDFVDKTTITESVNSKTINEYIKKSRLKVVIFYKVVPSYRTFYLKATDCMFHIGSAVFGATFNLKYTCRTTINFGTLKDSSLNILILNILPLKSYSHDF